MAFTTPRTWVAGEKVTAALLNVQLRDNMQYLYDARGSYAVISDTKAQNTGGGSLTAGAWTTRDLNTEDSDANSIVSIASNRFTPISGTYLVRVRAPFIAPAAFTNDQIGTRLYNFTAATVTLVGTSGNGASNNGRVDYHITGIFTANGTDSYAVQYFAVTAWNGGSAGTAGNRQAEVYTVVELVKIG